MCVKSLQSCRTVCDPVNSSPPGSSVHGILQVRILKWVAMPFSRDLPDPGIEPRSHALQADSLHSEPPGKQTNTKKQKQQKASQRNSFQHGIRTGFFSATYSMLGLPSWRRQLRICLQCGRPRFDPWVRKIPGEGNGYPGQYSCLENPMARGTWWATVHRVAKSWMQSSD